MRVQSRAYARELGRSSGDSTASHISAQTHLLEAKFSGFGNQSLPNGQESHRLTCAKTEL